MKKVMSLLLAISILFMLTACGTDAASTASSGLESIAEASPTPSPTPTPLPCNICNGQKISLCPQCLGSKDVKCEDCAGTGLILCEQCNGEGYFPCTFCNGDGEIEVDCKRCLGDGKVTTMGNEIFGGTQVVIGGAKTNLYEHDCGVCDGRGYTVEACGDCNGTGHAEPCQQCDSRGALGNCEKCMGSGQIACPTCRSAGTIDCILCKGTGNKTTLSDSEQRTFIDMCKFYSYDEISRNPDHYKQLPTTHGGSVIQVTETDGQQEYQVKWGTYLYHVTYERAPEEPRILEGDEVTVYGVYNGLYSYTTSRGSQNSIPWIIAVRITPQE